MILGAGPEEPGAEERAGAEIEGLPGLGSGLSLDGGAALGVRHRGEVQDGQAERDLLVDDLAGLAVDRGKGGTQDLMPAGDFPEGALDGLRVEAALEANSGGHVVEGVVGVDLVEEPEPLLGKGEREQALTRGALDGRSEEALPFPHRRFDLFGEGGDGRRLEDGPERQGHLEGVARAGDDLDGEERVAAEIVEALVDANLRLAEDIAPDGAEQLLDRRAGAGELFGCSSDWTRERAERACRFIFPLGVRGSAGRRRMVEGTMYSGRRSPRKLVSSAAIGAGFPLTA